MRILLLGEYSRLHNSLKEGLTALGHEVVLVGDGDAFKKYPMDVEIGNNRLKKWLPLPFRKLFFRLFKFDPIEFETIQRFKKKLPELKGFDIVQLINENALSVNPKFGIPLLERLFQQNKKKYLLSCGDDHVNITWFLSKKPKYSILNPLLENPKLKKKFGYSLKYVSKPYQKLHQFLIKNCNGVIASDMDYHLPYVGKSKYLGLIPNPINIDKIKYIPMKIDGKIRIFHGINEKSQIKKGNQYFEEALEIINRKYGDKIEINTVHSLPYKEYITLYDNCHILLDQVFSYDQGYNALEAMAKGKVVFSGAEKEWLEFYNTEEDTVLINALPNAEAIAKKLEWLILNPQKILEISKNARRFIEKEHDYRRIADKYMEVWREN